MKIVITGTTGFVGKALLDRLMGDGHQIYIIIRAHSDTSALPTNIHSLIDDGGAKTIENFFLDVKPDGIVHLASLFLAQHETEDIESLITSNILFSTRVLQAATKSKVSWFVNTGTFWQHYNNEDVNPVNLYAATKQAFEDIAKYYYEIHDINFVTIKLNDTFGSEDTRKKVFNLWKALADSDEILSMSPGEQIIDMSYIENIIDAYVMMIDNLDQDKKMVYKGQTFAITADERMSLKNLAKVYEQVSKTTLKIDWGVRPYRDREVMVPWDKGIPVPGWKQKISLKEAMEQVISEHKMKDKIDE